MGSKGGDGLEAGANGGRAGSKVGVEGKNELLGVCRRREPLNRAHRMGCGLDVWTEELRGWPCDLGQPTNNDTETYY